MWQLALCALLLMAVVLTLMPLFMFGPLNGVILGFFIGHIVLYGAWAAFGVWCFWFPVGKRGAGAMVLRIVLGLLGAVLLLRLAAHYLRAIESLFADPFMAVGLLWAIPAMLAVPVIGKRRVDGGGRRRVAERRGQPG